MRGAGSPARAGLAAHGSAVVVFGLAGSPITILSWQHAQDVELLRANRPALLFCVIALCSLSSAGRSGMMSPTVPE